MRSTAAYLGSGALMALYAVNVLGGKLTGSTLSGGGWFMGDVGEFLTVLAGVTLFVIGFYRTQAPPG